MTANDLIAGALRLINVLASGETPTDAEASDALEILNNMLDQWNAERLMVFTIQRQVFSLVAGQQAYTMGTGGDFNVARPPHIDRAGIINLNNPSQPLELPITYMTDQQWAAIPVKNITSTLPQYVWDDQGFPLRILSFWVVPNITCQVALYTWTALSSFTNLTTDNTFPPGYAKALRYNLALDLAPEYGSQVSAVVVAQAVASKGIIKSMNILPVDLRCDAALVNPRGTAYDWRTDLPAGNRQW